VSRARTGDRTALRRALRLSRRALGTTSPNPPVGAVVLDQSGEVVGEGWTRPPGGPHAEVVALAEAGERARGGTVVVTLEPCRHTGRTGPCTDALLAAGVARVVVGCPDPTAEAGGGARLLREAGVPVVTGVLRQEVARGPLEAWLTSRALGRPFVTWKYAATLDGRSAAADGSSRWITSAASRRDVHRLRAECDAVLAGVGTVLRDDPALDARPDLQAAAGPQPLRVLLDTHARTPVTARALRGPRPALVVTGPRTDDADCGYPDSLAVPLGGDGHVDLPAVLSALQEQRGVVSVLLEGGPTLAAAFVRARLVDRVVAYVAPALVGAGPAALAEIGVGTIAGALRLRLDDITRTGSDVRLTLRPGADEDAAGGADPDNGTGPDAGADAAPDPRRA
jgi:diaminohydroxyphosphoribosylaminopyrimidine deaminase/5-amino-6-(5-phosphoribosylamino)uracil reductase